MADWRADMIKKGKAYCEHVGVGPGVEGTKDLAEDRMMKWFAYEHLPEHLTMVSIKFYYELAYLLCAWVDAGPERTIALRKLLEAKDAAWSADEWGSFWEGELIRERNRNEVI